MTNSETVMALIKSILSRLENDKDIEFNPRERQVVWEEMYKQIGSCVLTESDVKNKILEKLKLKEEALNDSELTESDQYKTAKKMVRQELGENEIRGLYYQVSLRDFSKKVTSFLFKCEKIDEVFASDEAIEKKTLEILQKFNPESLH